MATAPQAAEIALYDAATHAVRRLAAAPSASASVVWDLFAADGRRVAAGLYTAELSATDATGRTHRAYLPLGVAP